MSEFERALKKLVEDPGFRDAVTREPRRLSADFERLDPHEVLLLMQVWHATGDPDARLSMLGLCHCCGGSTAAEDTSASQ